MIQTLKRFYSDTTLLKYSSHWLFAQGNLHPSAEKDFTIFCPFLTPKILIYLQHFTVNEPTMQVENHLQSPVWKMFQANTLTWGVEVCRATVDIYVLPLLLRASMEERYLTMVLGEWINHTHWVTVGTVLAINSQHGPSQSTSLLEWFRTIGGVGLMRLRNNGMTPKSLSLTCPCPYWSVNMFSEPMQLN